MFSSVQSLSRVRLFVTPWITSHQASLSITNSWSSHRLTSIESVMPSSHLILCLPLLLLPPIPLSIRVFSNESTLRMRWPKYWSFSFSIISSKEIPGLISFRMDWLDLLAVQGTLKSLLQHYSSKASILRCSAFFTVQLSHPYMTTGKTITLTRWTFVGKVMPLLLNMLSRLVITQYWKKQTWRVYPIWFQDLIQNCNCQDSTAWVKRYRECLNRRKYQDIDPQKYSQLTLTKEQRHFPGERMSFPQVVLELLDLHMFFLKKKPNIDIASFIKL